MKIVPLFGKSKQLPQTDRAALFWLTTEELRILRMAVHTTTKHFIDDGAGGARELRVTADDVEWALAISPELDRAKISEDQGDYTTGVKIYEKALADAGPSDYILMRIGICYARLGEWRRALLHLERGADLSPTNTEIRRLIDECRRAM